MRFIALALLLICLASRSYAEDKYYLLETEVLPAVQGLWPILSVASGSNKHELDMNPEKFTKLMMGPIGKMYPLSALQRLHLSANKPIRDTKQYALRVNSLPDTKWNAKSKKMLLDWFADDSRDEGQKEAMLVLLTLIKPKTTKTQVQEEKPHG